jgi:NodT family efflux transporter outer membrane factor (OMF) lipoprotein
VRATKDQLAASQSDYKYARQSLVATLAKSWFLATEATLQRDIATQAVASASALLQLARTRAEIGVGSELDVASASASLQTYRDSLVQIALAREQSLRALELLLGRFPAAQISPTRQFTALSAHVPAGLPSELLERRPDVIAAEKRVGAAFNLTQQARAARLPQLSLGVSGSAISSDVFVLNDQRNNPVWGIGGNILAPIFTGGALQGKVEIATAEQRQAVAAYAGTALKAFDDVESALTSESALQTSETVLALAVEDAGRALGFAQKRYEVGSVDFRYVQQQQLAYYVARMNLLHVQAERRVQRVNLYLALGGDFESST